MADIAPWLQSPWLQAMEAGANAGLALRRQQAAEQEIGLQTARTMMANEEARRRDEMAQREAGDRLRLAYEQLGLQERREAENVRMRQQAAVAANALRSQQMMATAANAAMAQQSVADRLKEVQRHNQAMETTAAERLKTIGAARPIHEPGAGIWERDPKTAKWSQVVTFPERPLRQTNLPRVKVDKDGNIESLSGNPNDPAVKQFMSDKQRELNLAKNQPGFFAKLFGAKAPVVAPALPTPGPVMPQAPPWPQQEEALPNPDPLGLFTK